MAKLSYQITEPVRRLVLAKMSDLGLTRGEFAGLCKTKTNVVPSHGPLQESTIRDIEKGKRADGRTVNLSPETLRCLALGLGMEFEAVRRLCKPLGIDPATDPATEPTTEPVTAIAKIAVPAATGLAVSEQPNPTTMTPAPATARVVVPVVPRQSTDRPAENGPVTYRTVNVGMVLNGDAPYSGEISKGFEEHLVHLLENSRFRPRIESVRIDPDLARAGGNRLLLNELLSDFPASKPDFLVTIGTQPAVFVMPFVQKSRIPLVFIGVTDPVKHGIVKTLGPDPDRGPIAGVVYGLSIELQMRFLAAAFPNRRIGFIWSPNYAQDRAVKAEVERFFAEGRFDPAQFRLIECEKPRLTHEQESAADVFFGYFFLNANFPAFKKSTTKPLVGVNTADVRRDAVASTGHDDREVGRIAAERIIYRNLLRGVALHDMEIIRPDSARLAINRRVLRERGFTISEAALDMASEIID